MEANKQSNTAGIILFIVIVVTALGGFVFLISKSGSSGNNQDSALQLDSQTATTAANPATTPEKNYSKQEIHQKLYKQIDLPQSYYPGKITDINAAKKTNQLLFRAYQGDYVLLYNNKIVVYDPKINVIRDISTGDIPSKVGLVEVD